MLSTVNFRKNKQTVIYQDVYVFVLFLFCFVLFCFFFFLARLLEQTTVVLGSSSIVPLNNQNIRTKVLSRVNKMFKGFVHPFRGFPPSILCVE